MWGHVIDASEGDPVQAILEATEGEGVDLVIEAAGLRQTRQQAVSILRPGGTAIFLALGMAETPVDFMQVVPKELHLRGTQCYTDADFAHAIDLLSEGQIQVDALTTEMALDAGPKAFEMLATNPGDAIKVVLRP